MLLKIFSLLILLLDSSIVILIFALLIDRLGKKIVLNEGLIKIVSSKALYLSLLISSLATLGSLYFSEGLNLPPCKLCWYQRILMYPQVTLFVVALIARTKDVYKYSLVMSVVGMVISGYHYFLQINPNPFAPCSTVGYSVSCAEKFTTYFGFITIPWMAFSAFFALTLLSLISIFPKKM